MMRNNVILFVDDNEIRFTVDGKVSVLDAISALVKTGDPLSIWKTITNAHPEILSFCDDYYFEKEAMSMVNSEGWEKIGLLLFDFISDNDPGIL
jgi:hypothetical protein